jgi:hypothetical protein
MSAIAGAGFSGIGGWTVTVVSFDRRGSGGSGVFSIAGQLRLARPMQHELRQAQRRARGATTAVTRFAPKIF